MPFMLRRINPCPSPGWEGATSAPAGWARPCLSVSVFQPRWWGCPFNAGIPCTPRPGRERMATVAASRPQQQKLPKAFCPLGVTICHPPHLAASSSLSG